MADTDTNLEAIHEGQAARVIRSQTEDHLMEQEEHIIMSLVRDYDGGSLTDEKLRGSIGEIAALRRFRIQLETKIRQGFVAAEKELGHGG